MTARPLLDELRHRAAEEQESARQEAARQVAQLNAAAHAEADRRAADAWAGHQRTTTQEHAVARADALRRSSEQLLPARAGALDVVFARAAQRIELRATHPDLQAALGRLLDDALRYLPDGPARARCAPGIASHVREAFATAGRTDAAVVEDQAVPLGAIVESGDGVVSVDATFARRLAHDRAALAAEFAARLAEARG